MAKYGNWFENAQNVLAKIANINTAGTTFSGGLTGTETTYTGLGGAISLSDKVALLDGTSSLCTKVLPDGTYIGQEIVFACIDSTSAVTITLTTPVAAASDVLTFTVGDLAIVRWTSAGWAAVQGITVA